MTKSHQFPSVPHTFLIQRTPAKVRLFVGRMDFCSTDLTPVTTVNIDSDANADRLIAALKTAAWKGDRKEWESIAAGLPEAVVLACDQALASLPPAESLMPGEDGVPMTVVRKVFMSMPDDGDLLLMLSGASAAGMQVLVENYRGDHHEVRCRVRLMSGETAAKQEQISKVWPTGDGSEPVERQLFGESELESVLADDRWKAQQTRAYWVWLVDGAPEDLESGNYSATGSWVVEYFEHPVPEDPEPIDLDEDEEFVVGTRNPWPLTARTRFVLWNSLVELLSMLEGGLEIWPEDATAPDDDDFMQDYPKMTWSQQRAWWVALRDACARLVEAMRTGNRWNPCTPAEEALIYVACQPGWVDAAQEMIEMRTSLRRQFAALPEGVELDFDELDEEEEYDGGADFDWEEVPGALAGDEDDG